MCLGRAFKMSRPVSLPFLIEDFYALLLFELKFCIKFLIAKSFTEIESFFFNLNYLAVLSNYFIHIEIEYWKNHTHNIDFVWRIIRTTHIRKMESIPAPTISRWCQWSLVQRHKWSHNSRDNLRGNIFTCQFWRGYNEWLHDECKVKA